MKQQGLVNGNGLIYHAHRHDTGKHGKNKEMDIRATSRLEMVPLQQKRKYVQQGG